MVTVQPELLSDHHLWKEMGGGSPSFGSIHGSPSRVHYLIQSKSQKIKTLTMRETTESWLTVQALESNSCNYILAL